jgi:HAD superfamily hydrolase (TIGR01509 family)
MSRSGYVSTPLSQQPAAIILDLDGTLVDTVEMRIEAWLRTFDQFGIPAGREHVAKLIGSDGRRLARVVADAAGSALDAALAEEIDRRAGEVYSELNTDPKPLPGARELLQALDAMGLRWAIATSSRPEQVGKSIESLNLPRPPAIIDGSRVEHAKPAPDLLLFVARELGIEPSHAWYVGDSLWDMQAARAAEMSPIGVASGSATTDELQEAGAWQTVDNLNHVLPMIKAPI